MILLAVAVASVALVRISRAEREASQQRDALRATTEQLQASLATEAQQTRKISELLRAAEQVSKQAEVEADHALRQTVVAEQASKQAEVERDRAHRQTAVAERAAREAEAAREEAEAAREEERKARAKEAAAAERLRQSEQDKKTIIDRAVGPIQQSP
jgi:hypothetical protein